MARTSTATRDLSQFTGHLDFPNTDIFRNDRDRETFVERLSELVPAGGATLYA